MTVFSRDELSTMLRLQSTPSLSMDVRRPEGLLRVRPPWQVDATTTGALDRLLLARQDEPAASYLQPTTLHSRLLSGCTGCTIDHTLAVRGPHFPRLCTPPAARARSRHSSTPRRWSPFPVLSRPPPLRRIPYRLAHRRRPLCLGAPVHPTFASRAASSPPGRSNDPSRAQQQKAARQLPKVDATFARSLGRSSFTEDCP